MSTTLGPFELAPLGIGTMNWGFSAIDRYLISGGVVPVSTLEAICALAHQHNIQFFDSAEGYGGGTGEQRLSQLSLTKSGSVSWNEIEMQNLKGDTYRPIIATKFLPTIWRFTKWQFFNAVRQSAKRLNVECIDLYFIHSPVHPLPVEFW